MKKMMMLLPVLLVAGWIQVPQAEAGDTDESAIKAVLHKQTHSYYQRNYESEADVWAHQPYILRMGNTGEPVVGWDTIGANYRTFMEENPEPIEDLEFTHTNFHIQINGDGAWVVYEQHLKGKAQGEPFSQDSRQVRFLARIDGQWKIVYQYTNVLSPEEGG